MFVVLQFLAVCLLYCTYTNYCTVHTPTTVLYIHQLLCCNTPTTVALRSTQPLTEMSTRYISWGVKAARPSYANCLEILGALTSWICKGMSRPVTEYRYLHLYIHVVAVCLSVCIPYFTCLAPLVHSLSLWYQNINNVFAQYPCCSFTS